MPKRPNDGSFSATLRCIFLPGVSPPAKIRLDWRKNLSPLGILPFIKQGPEKFEIPIDFEEENRYNYFCCQTKKFIG